MDSSVQVAFYELVQDERTGNVRERKAIWTVLEDSFTFELEENGRTTITNHRVAQETLDLLLERAYHMGLTPETPYQSDVADEYSLKTHIDVLIVDSNLNEHYYMCCLGEDLPMNTEAGEFGQTTLRFLELRKIPEQQPWYIRFLNYFADE